MLKSLRIFLALLSLLAVTLLFIDFTGTASHLWPWMAKIQLIPAIISTNLIVVGGIFLGTLIFGRIYCSIICPLGILQDAVNWMRGHVGSKKKRKNRFSYTKAWTRTRLTLLTIFALLFVMGLTTILAATIAGLLEPYSAYGRIASQIFAPAWDGANNLLADWSEKEGNYMFYQVASVVSVPVLIIAIATLLTVVIFAWRGGRDYCNTICPVGTILGYLAQFSLLKPVIDKDKCVRCGKCARNCKAKCIDAKNHKIDYTRCVECMDCISVCGEGAISYAFKQKETTEKKVEITSDNTKLAANEANGSRRGFLIAGALLAGNAVVKAANNADGGLTPLKNKKKAERQTPIAPAGAVSLRHLNQHCTGCQLCIQTCPHNVLSPNMSIEGFMQPVVDYSKGYCPTDCTECSNICPIGAFHPVDEEEKSSIKVGTAVVNLEVCLSSQGIDTCGKCSRECPAGAISMVPTKEGSETLMPLVDANICIGCGACEYYCPVGTVASMSEDSSAIHVEGVEVHTMV